MQYNGNVLLRIPLPPGRIGPNTASDSSTVYFCLVPTVGVVHFTDAAKCVLQVSLFHIPEVSNYNHWFLLQVGHSKMLQTFGGYCYLIYIEYSAISSSPADLWREVSRFIIINIVISWYRGTGCRLVSL